MTNTNKMYLTQAEADAKGLPSNEEQIERWNRAMRELRVGNGISIDRAVEIAKATTRS